MEVCTQGREVAHTPDQEVAGTPAPVAALIQAQVEGSTLVREAALIRDPVVVCILGQGVVSTPVRGEGFMPDPVAGCTRGQTQTPTWRFTLLGRFLSSNFERWV